MTATVSADLRFSLATRDDDPAIRRLLRENVMPGQICVSLEREPDYFADDGIPGNEKQTIVARENGRVVCMGSCAIRERFVNGQPCRVGYLGGLRLDTSVAGRFDIVRRGYEFFRELQVDNPANYYFTSIAAENIRARQFLERNLPEMPEYEFIGEFVTLLIPASRSSRRDEARSKAESGKREAKNEESLTSSATEDLVSWLRGFNSHYQLAPHWTAEELAALQPPGLCAEHFCLVRENGRITACAALWDQRAFKQTVIRGYVPWLMRMRPLLNFVSGITENARLPAVEETLANAFVSQLAGAPEETEQLITIVNQLRSAAQRQIELLTMGFAANDPRLATVRGRFRCREYRSRLYIVRWPGLGAAASALDNRCLAPEVALL